DWMTFDWDDELKNYVAAITEPVDSIVLGRKLAQGFIPHWAANPEEEGAEKINNTKKVVFTKTLDKSEWDNTVLAKGALVDEITNLKKQDGKDIIVYGGSTFVSALIKEGLIDEFHLFINPAAIGNGMSIFKELGSYQHLTLKKSLAFACGIVLLYYEPAHD
ncbi:MAG: dihydrofolate reductase, partial [Chloroflexi bacterium]